MAAQQAPAGDGQAEAYDMITQAVRQVMQEMGVGGQAASPPAQEQPAAQPAQAKSTGKGGKVDPDDFAKLQAAVAVLLEHVGLADMSSALQEAAGPSQQAAQEEVPAEAQTAMGAHPGQAADLPEDAVPIGPLDPAAAEAMAAAGASGRALAGRVGKLAALLRGGV
jgi:hypothetical protein